MPLEIVARLFDLSSDFIRPAKLIWSRTLTAFLFLGSVVLVFYITKRFFGILPARIVTIVFSTSAGFIVDSHYLTADIPVIFWMLLAFYFAQNICLYGRLDNYIWAGLITGIATATKYNGFVISIAIVVAHILSLNYISCQPAIFSKELALGLFMVPLGFLFGNPFALLDYQRFIADFTYNYITTPVYDGTASTEHGYWKFFSLFTEIIGVPALLVFGIAISFTIYLLLAKREKYWENKGILLLLSVFLLYYYKFSDFPRLEERFVLPIVHFWLMLSGPFWQKIKKQKIILSITLLAIINYNLLSSLYVGKIFAKDPRLQAQAWVQLNIPSGSSIESQKHTPTWNLIPGINLKDTRMPFISGRRKMFEQMFKSNSWLIAEVRKKEKEETTTLRWYTLEELMKRQPDYLALNSLGYERFFKGKMAANYPELGDYFNKLLAEQYSYKIVFDRRTPSTPKGVYPHKIELAENRMTILKKNLKESAN